MDKVLELNQLTKKYGSLTAVNNLSFSVERGNVYGLLGPNGSGKSTTLGMVLNVVNATDGSWKWFGEPHHTRSLKKVGAIIERPNFYPYLSAEKNLKIVATIKEVPEHKIAEKLEVVGLLNRKKSKFSTFSLGMKQRLAIAAALLNDPQVLILDEPTNGLDPQGIIQIRQIIQEIAATGTTIILASHLLDEVEKVCSHVVILDRGKAVYSGPVDQIAASKGTYELASPDMDQLMHTLQNLPHFTGIKAIHTNMISVMVEEDIAAEELNKLLFEQGVVLSHLVRKKDNLETQFFKLLQNHKD